MNKQQPVVIKENQEWSELKAEIYPPPPKFLQKGILQISRAPISIPRSWKQAHQGPYIKHHKAELPASKVYKNIGKHVIIFFFPKFSVAVSPAAPLPWQRDSCRQSRSREGSLLQLS